MKIWGICGQCLRFLGRKNKLNGCKIEKHSDGKYHLKDFQAIAKCPEFKKHNKK